MITNYEFKHLSQIEDRVDKIIKDKVWRETGVNVKERINIEIKNKIQARLINHQTFFIRPSFVYKEREVLRIK